jgi:hypothetical protein
LYRKEYWQSEVDGDIDAPDVVEVDVYSLAFDSLKFLQYEPLRKSVRAAATLSGTRDAA